MGWWGFLKCARFVFAAVFSGLEDWRTLVRRRARRTTGCHPGGCPGKWGEPGTPGSLWRLVRGIKFCLWSRSFPLQNRLILLPACGGHKRVMCVWICWFLFCVFLCMCLELCENLKKKNKSKGNSHRCFIPWLEIFYTWDVREWVLRKVVLSDYLGVTW